MSLKANWVIYYFKLVFYAQLAQEQNLFDFNDLVEQLNDKLTRRHPHVFGDKKELTDEQLSQQWQAIKAQERSARAQTESPSFWQDIPAICQA